MLHSLINFYWITLEVFFAFSILFLLTFGVIFSKLHGVVSLSRNWLRLSILTLFAGLVIIISQFLIGINGSISIAGGLLTLDSFTLLIKGFITIFALLLLFVSKDKTFRNLNIISFI